MVSCQHCWRQFLRSPVVWSVTCWLGSCNNNATCNKNGYGSTRCLFKSNVTSETAVFTCWKELQSILTNPNLSSDAKYYQYINVFWRYQNLRQAKQQPANIQTADVKTLDWNHRINEWTNGWMNEWTNEWTCKPKNKPWMPCLKHEFLAHLSELLAKLFRKTKIVGKHLTFVATL